MENDERIYRIDARELFRFLDAIQMHSTGDPWESGFDAAVEKVRDWLIADIGG